MLRTKKSAEAVNIAHIGECPTLLSWPTLWKSLFLTSLLRFRGVRIPILAVSRLRLPLFPLIVTNIEQVCHCRNGDLKMQENRWAVGAPYRNTLWGSLQHSPDPVASEEGASCPLPKNPFPLSPFGRPQSWPPCSFFYNDICWLAIGRR